MTYDQLFNCYQTVLKQRDDSELKLTMLTSFIDKRVGDMPEDLKQEFTDKLKELEL